MVRCFSLLWLLDAQLSPPTSLDGVAPNYVPHKYTLFLIGQSTEVQLGSQGVLQVAAP